MQCLCPCDHRPPRPTILVRFESRSFDYRLPEGTHLAKPGSGLRRRASRLHKAERADLAGELLGCNGFSDRSALRRWRLRGSRSSGQRPESARPAGGPMTLAICKPKKWVWPPDAAWPELACSGWARTHWAYSAKVLTDEDAGTASAIGNSTTVDAGRISRCAA